MSEVVAFAKIFSKKELHNAICANYKHRIQSEQDLEVAVIAWKKWYPDNMPASLSRHIVRTGDKSTMMTSVYENEELLNQAQVIAAQWWEMYGHHVYETIVFDGPTID